LNDETSITSNEQRKKTELRNIVDFLPANNRGNFKSKSAARRPETPKMALFLGEKALRQT
jgi:hypothetical protein